VDPCCPIIVQIEPLIDDDHQIIRIHMKFQISTSMPWPRIYRSL